MQMLLIINSILLIAIVLLQSGKSEDAGNIIQGGNADLFSNRKERGSELMISRITMFLGALFFLTCLFLSL